MIKVVVFTFLILAGFIPSYHAQAESDPQALSERLSRLIAQMDAIQKQQEQILSRQDAALEEIRNLKIQVRK